MRMALHSIALGLANIAALLAGFAVCRAVRPANQIAVQASVAAALSVVSFAAWLAAAAALAAGCGDDGASRGGGDGPTPAVSMKHLRSARFGDGSNQYGSAVAAGPGKTAVVAGDFYSGVDFGCGALSSAGSRDIFLAKIHSGGVCVWIKRFGDGVDQCARDAAVDAAGCIVLVGAFSGSVDFGGGMLSSAGTEDIHRAKFSGDGSHLWSPHFNDGVSQDDVSVAVDASAGVVVAGFSSGELDFGLGALRGAGDTDIFLAKFGLR